MLSFVLGKIILRCTKDATSRERIRYSLKNINSFAQVYLGVLIMQFIVQGRDKDGATSQKYTGKAYEMYFVDQSGN